MPMFPINNVAKTAKRVGVVTKHILFGSLVKTKQKCEKVDDPVYS